MLESPTLFSINSQRINARLIHGLFLGLGRKNFPVSNLIFADDLILFGCMDESTTFSVHQIMKKFCVMSNKKITKRKSKLTFSLNTHDDLCILFQNTLNMKESQDPGLYLGLPIPHRRPFRTQVQFVVDKVRTRLAKWKPSYISKASRLCLVTSTLSSIPAYYIQASCLPASTIRDLDQICSNFLWGESDQHKKKMHLVIRKETTFLSKKFGGLGLRDEGRMNKAYMAKLGWKMS